MAFNRKYGKFQKEYVWRKGNSDNPNLNRAIHVFGTHKMNQLSREELIKYGNELLKEARIRMSLLKRAGLASSPAYRYIKSHDITFGFSGKTDNEIKETILEAYGFLHTKTSTVENAREYESWLQQHLGETTEEQREKIWDVIHRFESLNPGQFIGFNYDETIRKIAEAVVSEEFDIDAATEKLNVLLKDTANFRNINIEFEGKERWFPGNYSTKG